MAVTLAHLAYTNDMKVDMHCEMSALVLGNHGCLHGTFTSTNDNYLLKLYNDAVSWLCNMSTTSHILLRQHNNQLSAKVCSNHHWFQCQMTNYQSRARAEPDGTHAETTFHFSPKRTGPFKSVGESVQSTAGSRGVHISVNNAGYTTFRVCVRVLATYSIHQFPLQFPSCASPCATTFRTQCTLRSM